MASHMAYLPSVSSPVARKRYTSPTTAMVRPSVGFRRVGGWVMVILLFSMPLRATTAQITAVILATNRATPKSPSVA